MEAGARSFDAVFEQNVRYLVPVFQRRYAWTLDRQWEPFWDDILEIVDGYVEGIGPDGQAPPSGSLPTHFFGAIVVKLVPFGTGELQRREVIDGQQRLTTIQLLIGAASRALPKLGGPEFGKALQGLIVNPSFMTKGQPDSEFKVWPTKFDRAAFRTVMKGAELNGELRGSRIAEAFSYFERSIIEWAERIPEEHLGEHLHALETVIRTQLKIVWIDLDEQDNAQVIFETLNDRGAPLNAIDLVKNFVFQRSGIDGETEDLYEKHWVWIEDDWWQEKVRLGRLERVRADVFLQHWLQMRSGAEVNSDYLFKSFTKMFEGASQEVSVLIPEFADDAAIYKSFWNQPEGSRRARFFDRLKVLDTSTPFPLVLLLFKQDVATLSPDSVDSCLDLLEDYLVRRMLMRASAQGYNRLFSELVKEVKANPVDAPGVIAAFFERMEGGSRWWPRDDQLTEMLTTHRAYGSGAIARERLLDVMWEIEWRRLRSNKHEELPKPPKLQIEHIMPRKWSDNWPLPEGDEAELAELRELAVNRLGNLSLVTDRLNPSLSNAAWSTKRPGLAEHSLLAMNQQLVAEFPDGFDEGSIASRGSRLSEEIISLWPGPEGLEPAAAS
ncbi:MAG: DUF262 domain-containing protein [Solirubrobacterales bacterium]